MLRNWTYDPLVQKGYSEPTYNTLSEVENLLETWLKNYEENGYRWAIVLNETRECIGQIAFCRTYLEDKIAEVEYCVGREYWGNGYATEAFNSIIIHTFDNTSFERLEAFCRVKNKKSERVLQKVNMKITDSAMRFKIDGVKPSGKICYAIIKD